MPEDGVDLPTLPQSLSQEQILNHLETLQNKIRTMQSWANGAAEQAKQDKLKIKTLEQQLAASKTLEWAKQSSASEGDSMGTEASSSESKRYTNPRLEQIRKAREAREATFRQRFSAAEKKSETIIGSGAEQDQVKVLELSQKVKELELQIDLEKSNAEKEKAARELAESAYSESEIQLQNKLNGKERIIVNLQQESEELEQIVEESFEEREKLQKTLQALEAQVKELAQALVLSEEKEKLQTAELLDFEKSKKELQNEVNSLQKLQQSMDEKETMISSFASKIEELRESGEKLEDEIEQLRPLREINASLIEKLSIATRKVELLESEVEERQKLHQIMETKDKSQTEELMNLRSSINGLQVDQNRINDSTADEAYYLEELENSQEVIRKLQSIVDKLQAEAKEDLKEREALLARESIWAEELSALKELVLTFKDSLELEKIKSHDDTHADEKSLLTSVQVSNEVEAQKALIELQEDEVLMLQSEVYDLLTQRNFDLMSVLEQHQKIMANMAQVETSKEQIRQLHCIIGDLQEEADEGEKTLEALLARETEYQEQVSTLQEQVDKLSSQLLAQESERDAQAIEQDSVINTFSVREREYRKSITSLEAEVARLSSELIIERKQPKREDVHFEKFGEVDADDEFGQELMEIHAEYMSQSSVESGGKADYLKMAQRNKHVCPSCVSKSNREEEYKQEILDLQADLIRMNMNVNKRDSSEKSGEFVDDGWKTEIHLLRKEIFRMNQRLHSEMGVPELGSEDIRHSNTGDVNLEVEVPLLRRELSQFVQMLQDVKDGNQASDGSSSGIASNYEDKSLSVEEEGSGEGSESLNAESNHSSVTMGVISTDESSIGSGFTEEITMLRDEVARLHLAQEKKYKGDVPAGYSSSESALGAESHSSIEDSVGNPSL